MKILILSCSHGRLPKNLKDYIKKNKIDMMISLGDHCDGDRLRSIVFNSENWAKLKGKEFYPTLKEIVGKEFEIIFRDYAFSGKSTLEELDSFGIPVLVLYGNNDFRNEDREKSGLNLPTFEDVVVSSENLMLFDGQKYEVSGYRLAGIGGYRNFPRSSVPQDHELEKISIERNKMKEKLVNILAGWKNTKTILIGHDQPRETDFDKVNYPASPAHGKPVGDDLLKEIIDKYQPVMYIGGHMHEHHGVSKIGDTVLVAAGHGRDGQCVILELPSLNVEKIVL